MDAPISRNAAALMSTDASARMPLSSVHMSLYSLTTASFLPMVSARSMASALGATDFAALRAEKNGICSAPDLALHTSRMFLAEV